MSSVNKTFLIGNLGRDPEIRTTKNGTKVANFSLATQRRVKQGDKWDNVTDWHNVTCYAKTAEVCEKFLLKGKQVYVEGSLRTDSWEKDGNRHSKTVVVAQNIQMLGKRDEGKSDSRATKESDYSSEDIPF